MAGKSFIRRILENAAREKAIRDSVHPVVVDTMQTSNSASADNPIAHIRREVDISPASTGSIFNRAYDVFRSLPDHVDQEPTVQELNDIALTREFEEK